MDDWFCLCLCSHAGLWRSATEKSGCALSDLLADPVSRLQRMTFIIVKGGHEIIEVLQIQILWNILFNTFRYLTTIRGRYLGIKL